MCSFEIEVKTGVKTTQTVKEKIEVIIRKYEDIFHTAENRKQNIGLITENRVDHTEIEIEKTEWIHYKGDIVGVPAEGLLIRTDGMKNSAGLLTE